MSIKYKVGIIGKGSVGAIALLHMIHNLGSRNLLDKSAISMVYDPSTPITKVGEASTWMLTTLLELVLRGDYVKVLNECGATPRKGASFEWDAKHYRDFKITYPSEGVHFDSAKFGDAVIQKVQQRYPGLLTLIEEKVSSIKNLAINNTHTFDLIFNCAGSPSKEEMKYSHNYVVPSFRSVNSALLYQNPVENPSSFYSHTLFHKNGWMFRIPLQHREGLGYLFNNKITTKAEALRDFQDKVPGLPTDSVLHISWEYYYRKNIVDKGVVYLGNKLYFFEPTQAMPLHFYIHLLNETANYYIDSMLLGTTNPEEAECKMNSIYQENIHQALSLICLSYSGNMEINSAFWDKVTEDARKHLKYSEYYQDQVSEYQNNNERSIAFWTHSPELMEEYIKGFKIPLPEKLIDE